jgi:hypothetical protein
VPEATIFFPDEVDGERRALEKRALFCAAGKALALATRFEANCIALDVMISLKSSDGSPLASERALADFVGKLWEKTLGSHIDRLFKESDIFPILTNARKARNAVAHELMLGFEYWHEPGKLRSFLSILRELVHEIALGELLVSTFLAALNKETLPSPGALSALPMLYEQWVFSGIERCS